MRAKVFCMKFENKYILVLLLLTATVLFSCNKKNAHEYPKVENAVINLENFDLESGNVLKLDGQWEFYYNQLLGPCDFKDNTPTNKTYQKIPSNIAKYEIDGKKLKSGQGYGTYRLKIIPNPKDTMYAIKVSRVDVSYKLFANNHLIAEGGKVATNRENNVPEWLTQTVNFKVDKDTVELILQIANFRHKKGGVSESIELSTFNHMEVHEKKFFA